MPKRSSRAKISEDANEAAFRIVKETTQRGEEQPKSSPKKRRKNPAAVALGRKGGKKGGKARADKLTAEQRSEIARLGAAARWKDRPKRES